MWILEIKHTMTQTCLTHSLTSSIVHNGTCCDNLCGTSSPIKRNACAAYLDAIAFGQLATFFNAFTAFISLNIYVEKKFNYIKSLFPLIILPRLVPEFF